LANDPPPQSFRQWLRQFHGEESAIGDLARDALADPQWSRGPGSLTRYVRHLEDSGAMGSAIDTLHQAWTRCQQDQRA
jgi:hypothetical protein